MSLKQWYRGLNGTFICLVQRHASGAEEWITLCADDALTRFGLR